MTATFRLAPEKRLVKGTYEPTVTAEVYRYAGACPAGRPSGKPLDSYSYATKGVTTLDLGGRLDGPAGVTCFAVWAVDSAGRRSAAPATATVTILRAPPQPQADGYQTSFEGDFSFTDISGTGEDPIAAWHWDFGDGTAADGRDVTHRYAQPGTYTVTLTVTGEDGQQATSQTQVVSSPPSTGRTVPVT
jgi:hypothetical protein